MLELPAELPSCMLKMTFLVCQIIISTTRKKWQQTCDISATGHANHNIIPEISTVKY